MKEVNGSYMEHILGLLASCPEEVLALVRQSILQASQALIDSIPVVLDVLIEAMVEKSIEVSVNLILIIRNLILFRD